MYSMKQPAKFHGTWGVVTASAWPLLCGLGCEDLPGEARMACGAGGGAAAGGEGGLIHVDISSLHFLLPHPASFKAARQ